MTRTKKHGRRLRRIAVVVVAAIAVACDATGPKTPVGNYTLASVNGKAVPFTAFTATDYQLEIVSGTLALNAPGDFRSVTGIRETVMGFVSLFMDTVDGTWAQDKNTLSLTTAVDSSRTSGTWSRGSVTMLFVDGTDRTTFVYARQ